MRRRLRGLPGRLRIEVRGLRGNAALGEKLDAVLRRQAGILEVGLNLLTGTALIFYDPRALAELRLIGLIEGFERAHMPQAARAKDGERLALRALEPALAATLGVSAAAGVSIFRAPQSAQEGLRTASTILAVAGGYPQVPTFGIDLNTPLDIARTLVYGATDNIIGLSASAVSSYGEFAGQLALRRAAKAIEHLGSRDLPAGAQARFTKMLAEDPRQQGDPLPPCARAYVETASVPGIVGGLAAAVLRGSWLAGLAVLAAANPRPVYDGATAVDAASLEHAATRRFFIRRRNVMARLAEIDVLLMDERTWKDAGEPAQLALDQLLRHRGGELLPPRRDGSGGVPDAVRDWQRRGKGVAVCAADPRYVHGLKIADVSIAIVVPSRMPPPYPADIIAGAADLTHLPEVFALADGVATINKQNRVAAGFLGMGAAFLAVIGALPLTGASAAYSMTMLFTTLNGRRLGWWARRARRRTGRWRIAISPPGATSRPLPPTGRRTARGPRAAPAGARIRGSGGAHRGATASVSGT